MKFAEMAKPCEVEKINKDMYKLTQIGYGRSNFYSIESFIISREVPVQYREIHTTYYIDAGLQAEENAPQLLNKEFSKMRISDNGAGRALFEMLSETINKIEKTDSDDEKEELFLKVFSATRSLYLKYAKLAVLRLEKESK